MKKKNTLALAALLATLSSTAMTPIDYAENPYDEINSNYDDDFFGYNCSSCMSETYCTPGSYGGPGFQDCASCYGREGPQGTTEDAENAE